MKPAATAAGSVLCLLIAGCGQPSATIDTTGRVVADSLTVQAPVLDVPRVNLDAGFAVVPSAGANLSAVPALVGVGSAQRVVEVRVRLGDRVRAGDVLLRFEDAALTAQVRAARADHALAKTQVGVIDSAIHITHDKEADLAEARTKVTDGIAKATRARKNLSAKLAQARKAAKDLPNQLTKVEKTITKLSANRVNAARTLGQLRANRATAAANLAEVEAALAALPPDAPASVRDPLLAARSRLQGAIRQLDAGITRLTAALRQIDAGLAKLKAGRTKLKAGIRQVNAAIPQLTTAIRTIDTNLVKANDALKRIDRGTKRLREARADLKRARTLAVIAAGDDTAVSHARTARSRAVVTAPRDGFITSIANVGDVLAPGATVATLSRPARLVQLWLAPAQAAQVCAGDAATVGFGADPAGTVSRILPLAQYPPTFHTTDDVHLTRAVPVEVTTDAALPPGVPIDVRLTPCQPTR